LLWLAELFCSWENDSWSCACGADGTDIYLPFLFLLNEKGEVLFKT
jgi:hypothetical protein